MPDIWTLRIRHWPRAALAGVEPVEAVGYPADVETNPAYFRPAEFRFTRPPSRRDFMRDRPPWTIVWDADLIPLIAAHPWPMVDWMHKSASVDLVDGVGRRVGDLEVSREPLHEAACYDRIATAITCDLLAEATRGLREDRRDRVRDAIRREENRIKERVARAVEDGAGDADQVMARELSRVARATK